MQIHCKIPTILRPISEYVIEVIKSRLQIELITSLHDSESYIFETEGKALKLPAYFITEEKDRWLQKRSSFQYNLKEKSFHSTRFYHLRCETLNSLDEKVDCEVDIFGSIFILLSRYEEYIHSEEKFDHFGRFKFSSASNFEQLNVPIVDELVELLRRLLEEKLELQILFQKSEFKILPSHDVDRPFEYLYYAKSHLLKRLGGDLLVRKSRKAFLKRFKNYWDVKGGNLKTDPYNTFNWLMDQSERNEIKSTFYFLTSITDSRYDQDYDLENEELQSLLLEINKRGHYIGLHPSFRASEIEGQVCKEYKVLKNACEKLGIKQDVIKSRYHYLRWNNRSIDELEKTGIKSDQTLTFAEKPGFRCGTCKPYPGFNFTKMKTSSITIEPLIMMEQSLFSSSYMNLLNNLEDAWNIVSDLKSNCREQNGNFTLLWHNNYFESQELKEFYKACIQ